MSVIVKGESSISSFVIVVFKFNTKFNLYLGTDAEC